MSLPMGVGPPMQCHGAILGGNALLTLSCVFKRVIFLKAACMRAPII